MPEPAYNSDPPTSGPHSPTSAACSVYTSDVADPLQVHNLDHGTVIIQCQPDLAPGQVEARHAARRFNLHMGQPSDLKVDRAIDQPTRRSQSQATPWTRRQPR